jgi:hypothetical protein
MKYILSFLLLVCMPFLAFSQTKALEKAVKKGKNPQNGTFFVEFDKYYDVSDVNQWFSKNSYTIWDNTKIEFPVYGDAKVGYRQIYFMTSEDYAYVQAEKRRIEEEQRRNSRSSSIDGNTIGLGLAALALIWGGSKLVKSAIENGAGSSGSYSGSSSTSESTSSKEVSPVVETGDWYKGNGTLDGAYEYRKITYADGTSGTLFKGESSGKYYISNGLSNTYFDSYNEALEGLYRYKTRTRR